MSFLKEDVNLISVINDVCRVCTVSNVAMVNIFNCVNRNIAKDIQFCTGIIISEYGNLPKNICIHCLQKLCVARKFKLNCLRAEKTFRRVHHRGKTKIKCERIDKNDVPAVLVCDDEDHDIQGLRLSDSDDPDPNKHDPEQAVSVCGAEDHDTQTLRLSDSDAENPDSNDHDDPTKLQSEADECNTLTALLSNADCDAQFVNLSDSNPDANDHDVPAKLQSKADEHNTLTVVMSKADNNDVVLPSDGSDSLPAKQWEPPKTVKKGYRTGSCSVCNAKFPTSRQLESHRRKCLRKQMPDCICEVCGRRVIHTSMYQHKLAHLPSKYFCDYCGYNTTNRGAFVNHIKLHTGQKNYQCRYCGKLFTVSVNHLRHVQRIHENGLEKRFACTVCDKKFPDKCRLNRHMLVHSDKKEFECEICDARFRYRNGWRGHQKYKHNIIVPLLKWGRKKSLKNEEEIKKNS